MSPEDLFARMEGSDEKELFASLKADVQGTVEAIREALAEALAPRRSRSSVIHSGVGGITESDVMLAAARRRRSVGFHVRPEPAARKLAEREGVDDPQLTTSSTSCSTT